MIPIFLGGFNLSAPVFLIGAAIVAVIDLATLRLATVLFRRETILTRWK